MFPGLQFQCQFRTPSSPSPSPPLPVLYSTPPIIDHPHTLDSRVRRPSFHHLDHSFHIRNPGVGFCFSVSWCAFCFAPLPLLLLLQAGKLRTRFEVPSTSPITNMSRSLQDQFIDDDEEETCPLCVEEFDLTDKGFRPCPCGYQVCPAWFITVLSFHLRLLTIACRYVNSAITTSRPI